MLLTYVFTGALIVASLIIQGHSSFDVLRIGGTKPDLLFIVIVYLAYNFGSFYGEVTGFISGLLHDSISNSPLGFLTFPKVVIGFVVGMFGRGILKETLLSVCLLLFLASLAKGIITLFLGYLFHEASIAIVASVIFTESFYNAILAPPMFLLMDKIFESQIVKEG